MLPDDGVGSARMEFIIGEHIGIFIRWRWSSGRSRLQGGKRRSRAASGTTHSRSIIRGETRRGADNRRPILPQAVIVRLSDFKTN